MAITQKNKKQQGCEYKVWFEIGEYTVTMQLRGSQGQNKGINAQKT